MIDCDELLNVEEALNGHDTDKWGKATKDEMNALQKVETWTIMEKLKHQKVITFKWLL